MLYLTIMRGKSPSTAHPILACTDQALIQDFLKTLTGLADERKQKADRTVPQPASDSTQAPQEATNDTAR